MRSLKEIATDIEGICNLIFKNKHKYSSMKLELYKMKLCKKYNISLKHINKILKD